MNNIEEKFEVARKELLDLSLKNPLINYRLRAATGLEFPSINASDVFDYLVNEGKNITFSKEPTNNPSKLYAGLDEKKLRSRLVRTYRSSKMFIEEKGANILFLALGFLKWKEKYNDTYYRSPLILVPVEMKKMDAGDKYYICYSGEEIRLNVSLITKMQTEFNINIDYDYEEEIKGIDEYFRFVSDNVAKAGYTTWEIETTKGSFDFFSYAKFLMYKDLDLNVWLEEDGKLKNSVLKRLFLTNFDDKLTPSYEVERNLDPNTIFNVVDADSSQALVIYDINQGKNMVIQGPPGTGKSQTITNIIASSVANHKSILFVSEKMAALDVVKTRLEKVGLGDLVLELHSQKANKKDVLKSIEATLNLGEVKMNDDTLLNEKYLATKNELDQYKDIVNEPIGRSELTLVDICGEALKLKEKMDSNNIHFPRIKIPSIETWSYDEYSSRLEVVKEYISLISYVGKIEKHPFYGVNLTECLPYEQVSIKEKISDLDDSLNALISTINEMGAIFGNKTINTLFDSGRIINSIEAIKKYQIISKINCADTFLVKNKEELDELILTGEKITSLRNMALGYKEDALYRYEEYLETYEKYNSLSFFKKNKAKDLKKELASYFGDETFSSYKVDNLYAFLKAYKLLKDNEDRLKYLFKELYKGMFDTSWKDIKDVLKPTREFLDEVNSYSILSQTRSVIQDEEKCDKLEELEQRYLDKKGDFIEKLEDFFTFSKYDYSKRFEYASWYEDMPFIELRKVISSWKNNADSIVEVVRYNSLKQQFKKLGVYPLFEYHRESGKYEYLDDMLSFEYFDSLINQAYSTYPSLNSLKEFKIERIISMFKDMDSRLMVENIKEILNRHYESMPSINDNSKEMNIIRRELQKKRNQMPIRKLFSKTGSTVQKIKPVFMMSPISVASFLPPKLMTFDLVVFDEASQVRPVEAFGSLLRARQIVVVGDSKQLPPTTFFDTMTSKYDEMNDEDYDISNMESILTLLLARNIPQRTLSWHYRSRNQSLISLSNNEFYSHSLKVFPSVYDKDPEQGLIFKYIPESTYSRGGTRSNKIEAREVIKAAFEHAKKYPTLSLGIASFSLSQQEELYREFDNQMKKCTDPKIKEYFSSNKDEPFFIKNLESVQGDERDAIFISIGYGYDENHNITMDFGPLNKEGGERRLNVLITRAKVKCVVFSNITSHDINLSKTNAQGVISLKRFLEYAQNRVIYKNKNSENKDDQFVDYLYNKLIDYGYEVDRTIGKEVGIDLAIYDKQLARFTVGIECDGGAYKDLNSTTDRERIRRNVLKSLGWKLVHIWTPDFYRNPKNNFEKLLDMIQEAEKDEKDEILVSKGKDIVVNRKINKEATKEILPLVPYKPYSGQKRRAQILDEEENLKILVEKICIAESPLHIAILKKRLMSITGVNKIKDEQNILILKSIKNNDRLEMKDDFIFDKKQEKIFVRNRELLDKGIKKLEYIADEELRSCIVRALDSGEASTLNEVIKVSSEYLSFSKTPKLEERIVNLINEMKNSKKIYEEEGCLYLED